MWTTIVDINGALQAIGYGLLVLFFAMGIFRSTASFKDFQRPEYALQHFIRFVLAKTAITYALDIMTGIFSICGGVVNTIGSSMGGMTYTDACLNRLLHNSYRLEMNGKNMRDLTPLNR